MELRCREGDLAIVVFDTPQCANNVGRVVVVSGPVRVDVARGPTWLIQPVAPDTWAVERVWTGRVEFHAPPLDGVEHPDRWLMPLRPAAPNNDRVGSAESSMAVG
jgi:hypothetical protein